MASGAQEEGCVSELKVYESASITNYMGACASLVICPPCYVEYYARIHLIMPVSLMFACSNIPNLTLLTQYNPVSLRPVY